MSTEEFSDVVLGRAVRFGLSAFVAVMISVLTYVANSVKDEFHDLNLQIARDDEQLRQHGVALAELKTTISALSDDLRNSTSSIETLASTIAIQATAEAKLQQRMDDADNLLKSIQPLGVEPSRRGQ